MASAVTSNPHGLRKLDVSYNWLQNSSVEKLTELVKDPRCRLTTLRSVQSRYFLLNLLLLDVSLNFDRKYRDGHGYI